MKEAEVKELLVKHGDPGGAFPPDIGIAQRHVR